MTYTTWLGICLRDIYIERVEGHKHTLVQHHRTRAIRGAQLGIRRVLVNGISRSQVLWVRVDGRIDSDASTDSSDEYAGEHRSIDHIPGVQIVPWVVVRSVAFVHSFYLGSVHDLRLKSIAQLPVDSAFDGVFIPEVLLILVVIIPSQPQWCQWPPIG